uniref:50S ribosomal protein L13 n=1 Tax=Gastroclonium compressum TaxID=1852973 RepID=A0A173G082_GASCM|nr:50S ribosomal protein L13 [Coeloseira compressa]ANH09677.1 50S ribosomal protein L13 [Coeloseira compressa]
MNKTYVPNKKAINVQAWYLIDGKDATLGRISTQAAKILRGKHKTIYTPYLYQKSTLIIINAEYIKITGNKSSKKIYTRHSGFPGGLKTETFDHLQKRKPEKIIEHAIKGMLPKGSLGKQLFRQLKVYSKNQHPHKAQQSQIICIN